MSLIPFEDLATSVINLIPQYFPTEESRNEAKLAIMKAQQESLQQQAQLAAQSDANQTEIDKAEAANGTLFSQWRSFIGWICGFALAYHFILQPLFAFVLSAAQHPVVLPDFDMGTLNTILMGLLGLGGLHSLEKLNGV